MRLSAKLLAAILSFFFSVTLFAQNSGNVTGTLLTDKIFLAQSDTGRVDLPKTVGGGKCEITTDTGNIEISVP